ncbi:hypothetical protein TRIATDRAFT_302062 [Trichoderma atroviride IMI 206040]|uniref:Uncharacterized protein n=1 Tax=Hypocrea atroviridis (strain ATCC 20476 / IMI 206040) TaxID=452589 RepID=G9P7B8_HYPAI|nr:uncharacterized protein TRIATDRAFT_302062 [Trichoderma atroviride IMI 206040]EHK41565.1 hypothetical protein TRIATDRAFT_302062 [Trichoderma atroviride IMI 206040]
MARWPAASHPVIQQLHYANLATHLSQGNEWMIVYSYAFAVLLLMLQIHCLAHAPIDERYMQAV